MASPALQPTSQPRTSRVWLARTGLVVITILRYMLGAWMMPYGISKLANIQFQVSAWDYTRPVHELSGALLTWAFLGYQPWFQFLLGVLESGPALMLLFRRTWRLGALLLFPTLLNVTLMNYALNLWDATKRISLTMLIINVILIACCRPAYLAFARTLLPKPRPIGRRWLRIASYVAEIAIPVLGISLFCYQFYGMVNQMLAFDFIGERQINRAGTWSLERMTVAGRDVAASGLVYFDFRGRCGYSSHGHETLGTFKSDRAKRSFEISGVPLDGDPSAISGGYNVDGDKLLLLGTQSGREVAIVLRRSGWGKMLPWK